MAKRSTTPAPPLSSTKEVISLKSLSSDIITTKSAIEMCQTNCTDIASTLSHYDNELVTLKKQTQALFEKTDKLLKMIEAILG